MAVPSKVVGVSLIPEDNGYIKQKKQLSTNYLSSADFLFASQKRQRDKMSENRKHK
jgi:hypothetical protein